MLLYIKAYRFIIEILLIQPYNVTNYSSILCIWLTFEKKHLALYTIVCKAKCFF